MKKQGARCFCLVVIIMALAMTFALVDNGWSQGGGPQMVPGETSVTSGRLEFRSHCAQCHGISGKGNGPVAAVLTKKPADLTVLAKNNNGVFPDDNVTSYINGSEMITAHGTREMPIWGIEFSRSRPGAPRKSVAAVNERIKMLVDYIKSIQEK